MVAFVANPASLSFRGATSQPPPAAPVPQLSLADRMAAFTPSQWAQDRGLGEMEKLINFGQALPPEFLQYLEANSSAPSGDPQDMWNDYVRRQEYNPSGGILDQLKSFVQDPATALFALTTGQLGGMTGAKAATGGDVGQGVKEDLAGLGAGAALASFLPATGLSTVEAAPASAPTLLAEGGNTAIPGVAWDAQQPSTMDMLANFANEEAEQGGLMQAADPAIGSAATGTGMWAGNTFNAGQVVPFGAPGDLAAAPAAAAPAAAPAPAGSSMPPAVVDPAAAEAAAGKSMFETIANQLVSPLGLVAASSLLGGKLQADAASDAAHIQADASDRALAANERAATASLAETQRQYDTTRSDLAPYREAGTGALGQLRTLAGDQGNNGAVTRNFTTDDFWKDPVVQLGYQSGLDLGKTALYNASPLTTGHDSGAALKELTKFGTDYTGSKAADSFSRFKFSQSDVFNKLASMAGIGQTATNTGAAAGSNAANTVAGVNMNAGTNAANLLAGQGNAGAASRIAGTNAWTGALGNIANWWQSQNILDRLQSMRGNNYGYQG